MHFLFPTVRGRRRRNVRVDLHQTRVAHAPWETRNACVLQLWKPPDAVRTPNGVVGYAVVPTCDGVELPGGVRGGQTLGFEPRDEAGGRRCDEGIAPADKSKAFLALALFVLPLGRVPP